MKNTNTAVLLPHQTTGEGFIKRKIGNTIYRVAVRYSETSNEHLEDKLLRLAKNDLADFSKNSLANANKCGIIELPQTGRLLEGGSLL